MEQQGLVLVMCGHRITKHSWVIAKVNLSHVHAWSSKGQCWLWLPSIEKLFGKSLAHSNKCFLVSLGHVHAYGTTKVNLGCVWAHNKANHVIKKVDIGYV
jgi:hypothetical protein